MGVTKAAVHERDASVPIRTDFLTQSQEFFYSLAKVYKPCSRHYHSLCINLATYISRTKLSHQLP